MEERTGRERESDREALSLNRGRFPSHLQFGFDVNIWDCKFHFGFAKSPPFFEYLRYLGRLGPRHRRAGDKSKQESFFWGNKTKSRKINIDLQRAFYHSQEDSSCIFRNYKFVTINAVM